MPIIKEFMPKIGFTPARIAEAQEPRIDTQVDPYGFNNAAEAAMTCCTA
jgi:hypothetical protein